MALSEKSWAQKRPASHQSEMTTDVTAMEIGGVTPVGLPQGIRIWIDAKIMVLDYIILGGGNRTSKLKLDPAYFTDIAEAEIIENLSRQ